LDQVVNIFDSGDRSQWLDPHPLQGRKSFFTFDRTGSGLSTFGRGRAVYVSTSSIQYERRLLGYEGLEVINPEGGTEDAEVEAQRGRWKQEVCYHFVYLSTISS
nr:hypothetical protein [Tanacetum cinerariifolium]